MTKTSPGKKSSRRGFFKLLGGLVAIGTAIGVAPSLLAPIRKAVENKLEVLCFEWKILAPGGVDMKEWTGAMMVAFDTKTGEITSDGVQEFQMQTVTTNKEA